MDEAKEKKSIFKTALNYILSEISYICSVKKRINKYFAVLLLAVMTAYSIPKELLHELHHHTDTVDGFYKSDATKEIGTKHTHCDVFHFEGPVLFYSFNENTITDNFTPYIHTATFIEEYFYHTTYDNFQRGPPCLSFV